MILTVNQKKKPKLPSSIVLEEPQIPQRKEFDYSDLQFQNRSHSYSPDHVKIDEFAELAKETFRRYEESNHRIDAFRLSLTSGLYVRFGFATEWTLNALKLGATDLTFRSRHHPNIAILLKQAVFGNENVVRLCLESSTIDRLQQVTECPSLKSLTLNGLSINSNALFDLISCFTSVEDLSLSNIYWKGNIEDLKSTASSVLILPELRSLVLSRVQSQFRIKTLFLDDLSSKFPNLKHLTLGITQNCSCPKHEVINISSAFLETLNISMEQLGNRVPKFEFHVPSIRKFTLEVDGKSIIPDVSFRSISAGYQYWEESHVSITNEDNDAEFYNTDPVSTTWFCRLSKFLTNLRGSKIHLCLHLHSKKIFDYHVEEINGLDVCEVEDLNLDIKDLPNLACHAFLDSLFRICRPKTITQYARPPDNNNNDGANSSRNNDLVICRLLEGAMQGKNVLLPTQFMYAFRDLEEVVAQQLIDEVWMPQPLGSILADVADSTSDQKSKRRFRFQLKWKSSFLNQ